MSEPNTVDRGDVTRFAGFAEIVLRPILGVTQRDLLQRIAADLWSVTFGRSREVVFAVTFLGGQILTGAAIRAAIALGVAISVPIAGLLLLFFGSLFATIVSRVVRVTGSLATPEMQAILRLEIAPMTATTNPAEHRRLRDAYRRSLGDILYGEHPRA